jgi:hypothetical protein
MRQKCPTRDQPAYKKLNFTILSSQPNGNPSAAATTFVFFTARSGRGSSAKYSREIELTQKKNSTIWDRLGCMY